ncbi:MAG: peptidylprolyl isomerase [Planctomycetota bacterium]
MSCTRSIALALTLTWITSVAAAEPDVPALPDGVYTAIDTNLGKMVLRLYHDKVPFTVANFVGLAEGTTPWTDPKTGEKVTRPFYDGLTFHRVIDGFMIQGGCPLGNGMGDPGYKFDDEFEPSLNHDRAGILSMANSGANTNGSQFFITLAPTTHLNKRHSVFGEVVQGLEVLQAIGKVRTETADRPVEPVVMNSVRVLRVGASAQGFATAEHLATLQAEREAKLAVEREKNRKDVPDATGEVDGTRLPESISTPYATVKVRYVLIQHRGCQGGHNGLYYDANGAMEVGRRIAALARLRDANFTDLVAKYSDDKRRSEATLSGSRMQPFLKPLMNMQAGNVSDPIAAPMGVFVFEILETTEGSANSPAPAGGGDQVSCRHILLQFAGCQRTKSDRTEAEARAKIEEALAALEAGGDFAELAKQYSDCPSAASGGDLGTFGRGAMVADFEKTAFALQPGKYSEIIRTPFGFHIVYRY